MVSFIWKPFNKQEYSVSFAGDDESFGTESITASLQRTHLLRYWQEGVKLIYFLHAWDTDKSILAGMAVLSLESLCPPFDGSTNLNIFHNCFGIKFHASGHTHVRAISPFEFTSCFGLTNHLCYCVSQHVNWYALDGGIPGLTLAWIFDHIQMNDGTKLGDFLD
jgi:hypothetical protein